MSRLPFELFLALRYLRPKRTFVSVITLISVIGVMLGVAVLIIVISVMSGFDKQMRDTILGFNAHLSVFQRADDGRGKPLSDYEAVMKLIRSNASVKGVAPEVMGQVLLETQPKEGDSQVSAPWVRGIVPSLETNVTSLASNIRRGEFNVTGRGLLMGRSLAEQLNLDVGDHVNIYSPAE